MTGSETLQPAGNVKPLPKVVEELAREHPNSTWMTIPNDAELTQGFRDITYRELADAVNGMTRWIGRAIGIGRRSTDIAAYIGINDARYAVAQIGLMKAGYMTMLPSPRNSADGQRSLFQTTKCNLLLHSEGINSHVDTIKTVLPGIQTLQIPSFDELCRQGSQSPFYAGAYNDKDDDRVVVLHTSGSTGLPKPIYHTNASIWTFAILKNLPAPAGRRHIQDVLFESDQPLLSVTPFFHMMGTAMLWRSVLCRSPLVTSPPEKPANADLIIKVLEQTKPKSGILPPSLLEQIVETPGGLETLTALESVFFGGGPLADAAGEKVNQVSRVYSIIGSTEAGLFVSRVPLEKDDWKYFEWAPGAGVHMEPDADGLYEMVIKPADRKYQAVFYVFPDITEWRTKDLFERHPAKPDLWLYKGRKDDVLVLSNGEKFNPVGFEKLLESHAFVKGAMVVGQARFQTGLIIEPEWTNILSEMDPSELLDQLWPDIEKANMASPAHGRVWKSKVAIAKKDKPFKRTPKGSIVRRQTNQLFEREIDALYSNEASDDTLGKLTADADVPTTKAFLRLIFKTKDFGVPETASDDDDLFSFGLDSLQTMALATTLSHACGGDVSPKDVYNNPTIEGLAKHLRGGEASASSREESMDAMFMKYTQDLTSKTARSSVPHPKKHTVILTGSTGSLGNYILQELIASPEVESVICLNRSADAESRQSQSFQARDVKPDFHKVTFLPAIFGRERFGLPQETYDSFLQTVDIFIHNAWAVDFNKTLPTYEDPHIKGTRRAIDFSLESKYNAQIVFISSIASVGNWFATHPHDEAVPERFAEDHSVALPQGYGESKHVASLILANAAKEAGVPCTIIRCGQLAGAITEGGEWNRHEWLPSIVISSKAMGMIPDRLGNQDTVDWVPMDIAAKSVVEIAESRSQRSQTAEKIAVAHLINPRVVSWSDLVPAVKASLEKETGTTMKVVSFKTWLAALAAIPRTTEEIQKKPGVKLIGFYEGLNSEAGGLPPMETTKTAELSRSVRDMKPVDAGLVGMWMGQWQR